MVEINESAPPGEKLSEPISIHRHQLALMKMLLAPLTKKTGFARAAMK